METLTVECPCGAVKLALDGPAAAHFYCHCDDCQVVHAAAYIPGAIYRFAQVRVVAGNPRLWQLRHSTRASCPACSTRLYAEPPDQALRTVSATLLPAGLFKPAFHIQCQHARAPVLDGLPHYKGWPPQFGGSDEVVGW